MSTIEFPALYGAAEAASTSRQLLYLNLLRGEYAFLLTAAVMTAFPSTERLYLIVYAVVFVLALFTLIWRSHSKPEQGWYKARALAESVKTLTWRFAMRAEPFDDDAAADARKDFRDSLAALMRSNRTIGSALAGVTVTGSQITPSMVSVRESALALRKGLYLEERVANQLTWYTKRARSNSRAATAWLGLGILAYGVAVILTIARIGNANAILPTEPLIVLASIVLGWVQIKKFNELSSVYILTAHEIGLVQSLIEDANTETDFTQAIIEAELAFSREHTQWVARQAS